MTFMFISVLKSCDTGLSTQWSAIDLQDTMDAIIRKTRCFSDKITMRIHSYKGSYHSFQVYFLW